MKPKLYLLSIILLATQSVFSKQHLEDRVFKSCANYSEIGANINKANHCCNFTIANPKSSKPIPAVKTIYFKTPAANISTFNTDNQYRNTVRIQNAGSNPVNVLSNPANCNIRVSFKNPNKQEVKVGIIDLAGRSVCKKTDKKDFDNYNSDALEAAVYIINILKDNVETKGS